MKNIRFSSFNSVKTKIYRSFKGVDMSTDPTLCDDNRSPWAPNLISDTGGMPEKRLGWRVLKTYSGTPAPKINGIYRAVINGTEKILIHAGSKIWDYATDPLLGTPLISGINDGSSCAIFFASKLYIFTGNEYLVYNGSTITAVEGRIPEIIIGRSPSGGGGTPLEPINLIQPKWIEGFLGEAGADEYQLSYDNLDSTVPIKVEVMDAQGTWNTLTAPTDYSCNYNTGKVTFTNPPGISPIAGADNVRITASKNRTGYADKVKKALVAGVYSGTTIFCAGSVKGTDYHSGFNDPTYWPDTGYDNVGTDETDIMGYLQIGQYLAIIKEDNDQDSTVYLRKDTTLNNEMIFVREPCVTGIGAISRKCFGNLRGEPLFLSRQGVFAVTSNIITSEKMVQNRSYFIDLALKKESGLKDAVAVEWEGYYIVAINGRAYILDGRQNKTYKQQNGDYVYECYHWDNIPARCFMKSGGTLYFGTADGRVCRFNSDKDKMDRYNDDDQAIVASWSTKADDDGLFTAYKSLVSPGCGVMIKPYTHSSAIVIFETEKDFGEVAASQRLDIFDFSDLDFSRFSFETSESPRVIPVRAKLRKYQTLRITVRNDSINEGFGVFGIVKRFTLSGHMR